MATIRLLILLFIFLGSHAAWAQHILLASTTSTENSGLFKALLPAFTQQTGIQVRVVAVGTGQALDIGRRGDADVLLVHDRASEDQFVQEGYGSARYDVMYNDFVIVGPLNQKAKFNSPADALACMRVIASNGQTFVSRGDKSGTHSAEKRLWQKAGLDPKTSGVHYKESGNGMGQTLNMASALNAFTLADRGSWAAFKNRGELDIICEGDKRLFNPYGVIPVSAMRHAHVKKVATDQFVKWLTAADKGLAIINAFRVNGEQVFFTHDK